MLTIEDLTYRIEGRPLFRGAGMTIAARQRTGLVGRNGCGKTTLFDLVTGERAPDGGTIRIAERARVGRVAQEAPATDASLLRTVLAADTERTRLLAEAETTDDPVRIGEIHARLSDIDAYGAEARAARILSGLGFDEAAQARPCRDFSGGWRMRVALAAVLFSQPDLLLLDEPTNYLDLEGTLWLESYLRRFPGTFLLISHDRNLLDRTCEAIVHVDDGKLVAYRGNFSSFERQRREKAVLQQKRAEKQAAEAERLQAFVDRFRAKATKARQAQSRLKMLERMETIEPVVDPDVPPIRIPDPATPLSPPILAMERVSVGYAPGAPVLRRLTVRIDEDDRIALLGANGNGKSTFSKLLAGRLSPMDGRIVAADRLKVAYFAQHQLDELDPSATVVDHIRRKMPDAPEASVRARAAQMGLGAGRMDTAARDLSGGERAKLMLGLAVFDGPQLLVLDEPTNHLDIDSRASLVGAINAFPGAVVMVSHDRHLLESCADRLWLVADGTVSPYEDDLDAYERLVLSERGSPGAEAKGKADKAAGHQEKDRRRRAAEVRAELAPLRKRIKAAEKAMDEARRRIETIDGKLADGTLYERAPDEAARLARDRARAAEALEAAEEDWLACSEEYEAATV